MNNPKEKNERLQLKISLIILVFALVFVCFFATYAFFIVPDSGKNQEVGLTSGNMSLTFSDGDAGINKRLEFGSTVTKIFTIENTGTVTSSLSLDWDNLVNTYLDGSLTFKLSYSETDGGEKQEILPSANVPTSSTPLTQNLASELSVPAGKTYYYYLDITLNNTDVDQTSDLKANFSTKFNVGLPSIYRYYKLSINPNGGTWKEFTDTQEYQLQNNETLDVPNPTKVGYTFTGWSIEGSTSTIENSIFTMGIEDTTLTANYTKNKYTVSIDIDGNIQTEETEYGGTINLPENPTKEGYTFTNWSVTGGTLNGNTLTITDPQDISVTANFVINNYKYIVYHNKQNIGGSGYTRVDADTDEGEAEYNSEITPGTKTYTGFGIPPVQNLTIKEETTYPPVLNKVEYNYSRNKHTLTLNLNGGSSTTTGGEMYYEETKELVPPTKTGYNFTNWTSTSGSLSDNTFTMKDSDATVTANYTAKTFTVTYNANGGAPTTQSKTVTYGSKYILPETTPTRDGYEFLGWFTASSGGTEITGDTTVSLNDNQTLYAQWKQLIEVTLLAGGGTFEKDGTTKSKTIYVDPNGTYGDQLVSTYYNSNEPHTGAYSFTQWSTLPESTSNPITSATKVTNTSNHTLYAIYEGGCFLKDTLIYTPAGYKKIQNLKVGDKVYSFNENTGKKEVDTIIKTTKHKNLSWLEVTLKDKTKMRITANHSVYDPINKEWKPIGEFKKGEYVLNSEGKKIKISKIKSHHEKSVTVYNFTVQKNHNYFVTNKNILVHNIGGIASSADNFHGGEDIVVTLDAIGNSTGGYFDGNTSVTTKKLILKHTGTYANLPSPSNKDSRIFDGWYTEKTGGTKVESTTQISKSSNHTLYAHWSGGCFLADTLIYTPNGYKKIQDIKIGDEVYSFNEETKKVEIDEVINTVSHPFNSIEDIILENNTAMHITWNHLIYDPINSKWKEAIFYQVGDYVLNDKNEKIKIISKKERTEDFTVYNFTVKNNHNYFVTKDNILVHNVASSAAG